MDHELIRLWNKTGAALLEDGIGYRLYVLENVKSSQSESYGLELNLDGTYSVTEQDGFVTEKYPAVIDQLAKAIYKVLNRASATV